MIKPEEAKLRFFQAPNGVVRLLIEFPRVTFEAFILRETEWTTEMTEREKVKSIKVHRCAT